MATNTADRDRITLAIAAMGGQGGGVLADWIVAIAETSGYFIQTTSVPGVAQRTGATIYYLELFPEKPDAPPPIMGLMPIPGDVDVVVAAELAEAGRAVQRGIVTPDRTTLIASSHRAYAYVEKSAMGDGRKSEAATEAAIREAARRLICFDMQALAEAHGTVISATLFGALAGSGVLPFARTGFEAAITGTGKAVEANLAAFAAAFERAAAPPTTASEPAASIAAERPPSPANAEVALLLRRIENDLDPAMRATARTGLARVLDYQDPAYASQYLDRLERCVKFTKSHAAGEDHGPLLDALARHLALWMTYEDTIRVADLKIRRERFDRCREEVRAGKDEIVLLTEFLHPRVEELADTLPAPLARWLLRTDWARNFLTHSVLRERKIHTSKLGGFALLYALASLRPMRRRTYRFVTEQRRIEDWLALVERLVADNYPAAIELVACQNLIKGYGDTHARGLANFNRIVEEIERQGHDRITAGMLQNLRAAALTDEHGEQLNAELARVA